MGSNKTTQERIAWTKRHLEAVKHPKYYTPEVPKDGALKKAIWKVVEFIDPRNPF